MYALGAMSCADCCFNVLHSCWLSPRTGDRSQVCEDGSTQISGALLTRSWKNLNGTLPKGTGMIRTFKLDMEIQVTFQ